MTAMVDPYPSRLKRPLDPFERRDPVIHSAAQQRKAGPLSEDLLARYERDGFLWFEGFFSRQRMEPFFAEMRKVAARPELAESGRVVTDPVNAELRTVFAMHEASGLFDALTRDPGLLDIVHQLLGSDVYIHQSRINDKSGFQGSGFYWHSDFETWHAEDGMPRMRAVSASLMLTDNNEFNGPLMLIPGSHRYFIPCVGQTPPRHWETSLKSQRLGVADRDTLTRLANQGGIHAPKGPAGSLLLFECNVLHASNENMSPWPRANLFFVYNSVKNRLTAPYAAPEPRPDYLGARRNTRALLPVEATGFDAPRKPASGNRAVRHL